jgi:hypothetical protein
VTIHERARENSFDRFRWTIWRLDELVETEGVIAPGGFCEKIKEGIRVVAALENLRDKGQQCGEVRAIVDEDDKRLEE